MSHLRWNHYLVPLITKLYHKGTHTRKLSGVVHGNGFVFEPVEEECRATHGHDISAVIISLLCEKLSEEACELSGEGLHAGEGTDEDQSSGFDLLHELEGDSGTDGPADDDDVFLFEAELVGEELVDGVAVLFDGLGVYFSGVYAISRIFHSEDITLDRCSSTW